MYWFTRPRSELTLTRCSGLPQALDYEKELVIAKIDGSDGSKVYARQAHDPDDDRTIEISENLTPEKQVRTFATAIWKQYAIYMSI